MLIPLGLAMRSITLISLVLLASATHAGTAPPPVVDAPRGWLERVSEDIRLGEYHLSYADGGWTAPNRAQGLRSTWREGRLEVSPRVAGDAWRFTYSLVEAGRAGSETAATKVVHERIEDGRLEWTRGAIREWYVNDERGIEQGFVIESRPPGIKDEPFALTGAIDGLLAYPSDDCSTVMLKTPAGKDAIRVSHLKAWDAEKRELAAWFVVDTGILEIVVDDRDAVYPVTIDPLLADPSWTVEGDAFYTRQGASVATAGDVNGDGYSDVLVGEPLWDDTGDPNTSTDDRTDVGRVQLYLGSPAGLATTSATILRGESAMSQFGWSAASAGDVNGDGYGDVIVGAPQHSALALHGGKAWLHLGSASGLSPVAAWTAVGSSSEMQFGYCVATAGDVNGDGFDDAIVGGPGAPAPVGGRAFVYHGSAQGLSAMPAWTEFSLDYGGSNRFGHSVASAGDVNGDGYGDVIVGDPHGVNIFFDDVSGAAYAFYGSPAGLGATSQWGAYADADWKDPFIFPFGVGFFGDTVTSAGDVNGDGYGDVLVAETGKDMDGGVFADPDDGEIYAFLGSPTGLSHGYSWRASGQVDQRDGTTGIRAASAGDVNGDGYGDVVISILGSDEVSVHHGSSTGLAAGPPPLREAAAPNWTEASDRPGDDFGRVVALAGDVNGDGFSDIIVGAPLHDPVGFHVTADNGRASVFHGSADGLATTAEWSKESDQTSAAFATSVAAAGDVDGDGFSDILVGAPRFDNGEQDEGRAFLYAGSATGPATTAAWTAEGNQVSAWFGHSVSGAGDVNGDGYGDVVVGAPLHDNGQVDEGRVYLYRGSATGLAATPAFTGESNKMTARYGWSVAAAGDVNRDGYGDVIVGAPLYDNGQADEGAIHVYLGGATFGTSVMLRELNQAGARFGESVTGAGDLDRDGYGDVAAGAPGWDNDQVDEGRVYLFRGMNTGIGTAAARSIERGQASASFGAAVAGAGDVNGDGFSDLLIGSPTADNGQTDEGRAFLYLGASPLSAMPLGWNGESDQANAKYGSSVASAGDVNGDGYGDVIVGAPDFDGGQTDEGRAFVHLGAASGLLTTPAWTAESNQSLARLGSSVAGVGDVNADGFGDIIAGAASYDAGQADEGRAFLHYGNGGRGLDRMRRAMRLDGTAPIDFPHATTNNSFRIRSGMRTPFGRSKVRLEVEVERLDTPFDGQGLIVSGFSDTGAPGPSGSVVTLGHALGTLSPNGEVKWRSRLRASGPFPWVSHWMGSARNGLTEADLRIQPSDLTVTAMNAPATSGQGMTITVTNTVKNNGPGTAAASTARIWLSSDTVLDGSDSLLASRAVPQLAANATSNGSTSVTLPSPRVGTYYLIVQADALSVIQESNETNNTRSKSIVLGPDLQVVVLTHLASARVGTNLSISSTTRNAGGGSAAASTTRFWLSLDRVIGAGDVLLGSRAIPTLAPLTSNAGATSVTIPAGTVPGSYFVVAAADALAGVSETIETNNERSNPITILP